MLGLWHILTTVSISATVAGLVLFAARTWFKTAIENRYRNELEDLKAHHAREMEVLKADLASRTPLRAAVAQRRDAAYTQLAELIYRTRNMCRDASAQFPRLNVSLRTELQDRLGQLSDLLYAHRLDLERDDLFRLVHQYKTAAMTFGRRMADIEVMSLQHQPGSATNDPDCAIPQLYLYVDELYNTTIAALNICMNEGPAGELTSNVPQVERTRGQP
jgi:hypothetical protein